MSNKIYVGVDNSSEVDIQFSKAQRADIRKLAKQAKVTEAELLAIHLQRISIAGLAGTALRIIAENKRNK